MVEQTISIELTETEYKHIKEVLAMDKPSRTRLTQYEKDYLLRLVYLDMEAIPSKDWVDTWKLHKEHFKDRIKMNTSITKKLSK